MRAFNVNHRALSICVAAALLSACGGSSVPFRAGDNASGDRGAPKNARAVGMRVTAHPPHRSERAEFPHSAPTSGT